MGQETQWKEERPSLASRIERHKVRLMLVAANILGIGVLVIALNNRETDADKQEAIRNAVQLTLNVQLTGTKVLENPTGTPTPSSTPEPLPTQTATNTETSTATSTQTPTTEATRTPNPVLTMTQLSAQETQVAEARILSLRNWLAKYKERTGYDGANSSSLQANLIPADNSGFSGFEYGPKEINNLQTIEAANFKRTIHNTYAFFVEALRQRELGISNSDYLLDILMDPFVFQADINTKSTEGMGFGMSADFLKTVFPTSIKLPENRFQQFDTTSGEVSFWQDPDGSYSLIQEMYSGVSHIDGLRAPAAAAIQLAFKGTNATEQDIQYYTESLLMYWAQISGDSVAVFADENGTHYAVDTACQLFPLPEFSQRAGLELTADYVDLSTDREKTGFEAFSVDNINAAVDWSHARGENIGLAFLKIASTQFSGSFAERFEQLKKSMRFGLASPQNKEHEDQRYSDLQEGVGIQMYIPCEKVAPPFVETSTPTYVLTRTPEDTDVPPGTPTPSETPHPSDTPESTPTLASTNIQQPTPSFVPSNTPWVEPTLPERTSTPIQRMVKLLKKAIRGAFNIFGRNK